MRGNIKPFDNTKQYIQATKRQGQVSVLPELDGSKLINLPTVQSSSKLNYLLFRIPKIENDTEYYNFKIQFSNDGYFSNVIEINTFDNIELFSIFTGGALMPLGEIYVSSISGDDVNIVDNTKISVDVSEQILQLNIKNIKDFNRDYKYFRFQWIDKNQEGGKIGYGNLQAGGIQIFDTQFVEISKNENNILTKDEAGALYAPSPSKINKLLFRIPVIQNVQEIYHLKVQFSKTGDFKDVKTIDTINNYLLFKIFDGTGILKQFPIFKNEKNEIEPVGITSVYSDEQIQLDIEDTKDIEGFNRDYKYFRFQWSNNGGQSYGRYGYGNTQALQSIFDITSVETNVINSNKQIFFTHQDSEFVKWNDNVATFTHNMNCIPITTIYDDNLEQVLYGIKIIDGNSFLIDFKESLQITQPWRIIINYGVNFNIQ